MSIIFAEQKTLIIDKTTGQPVVINSDGSLSVVVTQDGNELVVESNGSIKVKDQYSANILAELKKINRKLNNIT